MIKYLPDCYLPSAVKGSCVSHEAICVLNTGKEAVNIELTLYFTDREKIDGLKFTVEPERTARIRMDQITLPDGSPVPRDTPYALSLEYDKEISLQYTRVDTTQAELAMITTML